MTRSVFQTPARREIAGRAVDILKLPFEVFDDALTVGNWMQDRSDMFDLTALEALRKGDPVRAALDRLLAACVMPIEDDQAVALTVADIGAMPIAAIAEAVYVVLEENLDFFMATLAAIQPIQQRLMSIGLQLRSSSSLPVTPGMISAATPTPN
ncbi:hypothetical protein [Pigmentiphaga kullae]|nr:hypothetical protein [Pigmentiphaga kullae]